MSDNLIAQINQKLDLADRLIRWQIALMALVTAGAVWGTTTNFRISAIENERAKRIPLFEEWKRTTDIELSNHAARISSLEAFH